MTAPSMLDVMAAADMVEQLCDWTADFRGAQGLCPQHRDWHYGSVCPYRAMAEVLRGNPDPRRIAPKGLAHAPMWGTVDEGPAA